MLEHIGGVADVEGRVAERQAHAIADDRPASNLAASGQLTDVGVEREVVAPAAWKVSLKYPGPPPTSSIVAPRNRAKLSSWAAESRARAV